jgi:hypothetical protein
MLSCGCLSEVWDGAEDSPSCPDTVTRQRWAEKSLGRGDESLRAKPPLLSPPGNWGFQMSPVGWEGVLLPWEEKALPLSSREMTWQDKLASALRAWVTWQLWQSPSPWELVHFLSLLSSKQKKRCSLCSQVLWKCRLQLRRRAGLRNSWVVVGQLFDLLGLG